MPREAGKGLRAGYLKHYWPENPLEAEPTRGVRQVALELRDSGGTPLCGSVDLQFALNPEQCESLRWYLEDYLRYPEPPAYVYARVGVDTLGCSALLPASGQQRLPHPEQPTSHVRELLR